MRDQTILAKESTRVEFLTGVASKYGSFSRGAVRSLPNKRAEEFLANGWARIADDSIVALVEELRDMGVVQLTFKPGTKPSEDMISVLRKAKVAYTTKGKK